jgi:hypothetical protein
MILDYKNNLKHTNHFQEKPPFLRKEDSKISYNVTARSLHLKLSYAVGKLAVVRILTNIQGYFGIPKIIVKE